MKRILLALCVTLLIPVVAGVTTIGEDRMVIELSDPGEADSATLHRHYEEIASDQLSYLILSRYNPRDIVATDALGRLDCEIDDLAIGKEVLCTPRKRTNYTVTISFTGDFVARNGLNQFSYVKRISFLTDRVDTRVILPEGYGITSDGEAYEPGYGRVGSEGRRIYVDWPTDTVSVGDTINYRITYEPLTRLNQSLPLIVGVLIGLVVILGLALFYVRRRQTEKTIASVFPVLKEDEKDLIRFIIEEGGEVEQREVVDHSPYSKAKISSLVSDLEERHLIVKEKQGRINILRLARDIGELNGDD